jgi:hypothetical protein
VTAVLLLSSAARQESLSASLDSTIFYSVASPVIRLVPSSPRIF